MPPLKESEGEGTMSSKNYNVGRVLNQGFKSFLLLLAVVIALSLVVNSLRSSMTFLLLVPTVLSAIYIGYLYIHNS